MQPHSLHPRAQPLSRPIISFFNDAAPPEISPLSLHDALPISAAGAQDVLALARHLERKADAPRQLGAEVVRDRKSTRLNSSHSQISYAVFCLKKKKF